MSKLPAPNYRIAAPECCLACGYLFSSDMKTFTCQQHTEIVYTDIIDPVWSVCDDWRVLDPEMFFGQAEILLTVDEVQP